MAILESVKGINVYVCVDGEPLEEYDNDEVIEDIPGDKVTQYQAARTVSKYIEACSGKEFSFRIEVTPEYNIGCPSLLFSIYIDGKLMTTPFFDVNKCHFSADYCRLLETKVIKREGIKVPPTVGSQQAQLRKFIFSEIKTTNEDTEVHELDENMGEPHKLGEILIKVHRTGELVRVQRPHYKSLPASAKHPIKFNEKSLKGEAKSHNTILGPSSQLQQKEGSCHAKKLDGKDFPIAIFKFQYRSKEALQQLLILERSPSPSPAQEDIPQASPVSVDNIKLESLDASQKKGLDQFLKRLVGGNINSDNRPIKREGDVGDGEHSQKRLRRPSGKVVVDLTLDSDEGNGDPRH